MESTFKAYQGGLSTGDPLELHHVASVEKCLTPLRRAPLVPPPPALRPGPVEVVQSDRTLLGTRALLLVASCY